MSIFKYLILLIFMVLMLSCSRDVDPLTSSTDTQPSVISDVDDLQALDTEGITKRSYSKPIRVMTRNIYIGTDVDVVLGADDPSQIPTLAAQAFQGLIATNFPERAVSLAREIFFTRPDLIGLQEVSLIRLQSPGDAVTGGTVPAEDVLMDYLDIFMATLDAMGLNYKVAAKNQNADVEIPMLTGTNPLSFDDVRVTDYDVILVKNSIQVSDVESKNYQYNLTLPQVGLEILRGYSAIDASVSGRTYRFVNTHLEPFSVDIQLAQVQELLTNLSDEDLPVVLVGDFNSEAPTGDTYNFVVSHDYDDVWLKNIFKFNPDGYTYGHDADLRNDKPEFWQRIDYIFAKNSPGSSANLGKAVLAIVVGDEQFNRTVSGLWPSDHGGVVAQFSFPNLNPHLSYEHTHHKSKN